MLLYIIVFFLLIGLWSGDALIKKTGHSQFHLYFIWLAFIILVIFRSFVNIDSLPDLRPYYNVWQEVSAPSWKVFFNYLSWRWSSVERGYLILSKICSNLSDNFELHLVVCSIVSVGCFTGTMFRYSKFFWVSLLMYFTFIFPMSSYILRQYLAMSVLLITIPFVIDRKIIPFFLILFLAYNLHTSAIIFTPIYFLYGIKKKRNLLISFFFLIIAISILLPLLGGYLEDMGSTFEYYSNTYINADKYSKGAKLTSFIISFVYLFFYWFFLRESAFEDGINRFILICLLLSTVISFMLTGIGLMFRIVVYFQMIYILAIPKTMEYIKDEGIRAVFCVAVLSLNFIREFVLNSESDISKLSMNFENISIIIILLIIVSGLFLFKIKGSQSKKNDV